MLFRSRGTIIAFVLIALAIIGGSVLLILTQPGPVQITINPPIPTATPLPTATPSPLTVYVTGAVGQPETLLILAPGSRVQDAIEAAGGFSVSADRERVNLAQILRDGDQIHVPELNEAVALPTPNTGGVVHVNTATVEELATMPGIGPSLAQRIIDYREANGPFTSLADLDAVSGIGESTLENLADLVAFD